ncbi:RNA-binding protein (RRM domain) [Giardia duodenalis]|uniref:RNA-binding protein (RRM domain) n=1 Tax=Giardia intestinalis TaxID=5741 RepID=V6U869_GIAIN|nr:RNA-binding protein (RRM domain) [Giardia intestinalis]
MSRVFVKNLAKKATESDVQKHFQSIGTITDVRLLFKEDGTSRRVAYVGFLDEASADKAIAKLNHSYIRTSRISVEKALPRSAIEAEQKLKEEDRERQHQERLAKHQGGARELIDQMRKEGGQKLQEYIQIAGQRSWEDNVVCVANNADNQHDSDAPEEVDAGGESRMMPEDDQVAEDYGQDLIDTNDVEIDAVRIKLTGLANVTTEDHLLKHFSPYGEISETVVCLDKLTHKPTGVGFVTFCLPEAAFRAKKQRDTIINGKVVRITPARAIILPGAHKEYLVKGLDKHNKLAWNPSYMRSNTVASVIAERLNLDQTALTSNAVGLAVAEAHLVEEATAILKTHGILIADEAIRATDAQRSKTVILCKNLPSDVDISEISQHFEQYGAVLRCVQPCPGFAIVELGAPQDARKAFNMLAFKRVGKLKVPMFLEFAMMQNSINQAKDDDNHTQQRGSESASTAPPARREAPTTVYIKNISFSTAPDRVYAIIKELPKNASCRLVLHAHGHKGYGFAEFLTKESAKEAIEKISNITLDGHKWSASLARGNDGEIVQHTAEAGATAKLIIKNLAFQANGKELKQLVSQFGRVVSFRAPRKLDGRLRGFAFVQYATEKEAEVALNRIKLTHFYGRHLVPEFTTEDQGLDADDAYTHTEKRKLKK